MSVRDPNLTEVCFNAPICIELKPPEPEGRKDHYSYQEITNITSAMKLDGWDERAVVMLRSINNKYYNALPTNWGIVIDMKCGVSFKDPYYPLKVKWFDGSTSEHWPEDLFLVHKALSRYQVESLMSKQE